jgi:NAD(P)H-dependent FMN reductase
MKKILFILGSLREKSFNKQVAKHVSQLLEGKAQVEWLDYADLPFVNQDIEFPAPEPVARVRKEVMDADALWVFSPEYNYSYPGHVKNLFDWLSRPVRADDPDKKTAIRGKKVVLTGIGGKNKTKDCREKLTSLLDFLGAEVLPNQVGLMVNVEAWTTDVVVLDESQKQELQEQVDALLNSIK